MTKQKLVNSKSELHTS